jgi:hypothetical protein
VSPYLIAGKFQQSWKIFQVSLLVSGPTWNKQVLVILKRPAAASDGEVPLTRTSNTVVVTTKVAVKTNTTRELANVEI